MIKTTINHLYSTGTRGVRIFNLAVSLVWFLVISAHLLNLPIDIPTGIIDYEWVILVMALITAILSISSLTKNRYRVMHKYLSLHTGAFLQAIICVGYAKGYPPLPVAPITSFLFSLWLMGAAYFVMDSESHKFDENEKDMDKGGMYDRRIRFPKGL